MSVAGLIVSLLLLTLSSSASADEHGKNLFLENCAVCHGSGSRSSNAGTVLSVAKADRNLRGTIVYKGEPVGCSVCHGSSSLSD